MILLLTIVASLQSNVSRTKTYDWEELSQLAVVCAAATASAQSLPQRLAAALLPVPVLVQQWGLIMLMMLSSGSTLEVELVFICSEYILMCL
jgi:hypothetical protein